MKESIIDWWLEWVGLTDKELETILFEEKKGSEMLPF